MTHIDLCLIICQQSHKIFTDRDGGEKNIFCSTSYILSQNKVLEIGQYELSL